MGAGHFLRFLGLGVGVSAGANFELAAGKFTKPSSEGSSLAIGSTPAFMDLLCRGGGGRASRHGDPSSDSVAGLTLLLGG